MVLSREDAGAEQIFRNDGVKLIKKLLQAKQEDLVLSALRTLVGLCTGHQSRVSVMIPSKLVDVFPFTVKSAVDHFIDQCLYGEHNRSACNTSKMLCC